MAEDVASGTEHLGRTYQGEQGTYRVLEIIGAGGMGVVCLGEAEKGGRQVAIKFLHEDLAAESGSSRERFEREIRVLQDLKAFRGIVQIEDLGRTPEGALFLVMEYVTGRPLNDIMAENPGGLRQIRAVQIIIEILLVLEPIHRRGFVHRDLKPHNICVYDEPLGVRLLDFGLSKPYQEGLGYEKVTRKVGGKASEIPGSPHYMAEEQFLRPREVDERTDLYAVGIVLYELIAGVPPFRGIYLQDILKQHRDKEPPPIDQTADGGPISYRLQAVIEKALAKKPESRYQTAGEFKEALYDVLNMLNKARQPRKALDSRYRIIKKIGAGGNSEVFEAEDLVENREVALKIVREGSSDWDEETLINEADRALAHENIVRVYEFGTFDGRPVLVMEHIGGGTVSELMEQYADKGLPESVFYRVVIDVCRGLHHAHQSNIVHRDVKPENMLRTLDGRIKVADFGIAKRFDPAEGDTGGAKNTMLAKGTALYISPEQCDLEGRVDRRADIYSFGCAMYEMLSGRHPFTEGILIMQHLQNDPPPLEVRGDFKNPDELCRIVERCMKKRKDERFQTMKELAQEIVRVSKLAPQKKPHRPYPIDTGKDSYLVERGITQDRTATAPQPTTPAGIPLSRLVLFGAPALLAVVAILFFVMKGENSSGRENAGGPPAAVSPEELLSRRTFDQADAALRDLDVGTLAGIDLEAITGVGEAGATRLDTLKRAIAGRAAAPLGRPAATAEELRAQAEHAARMAPVVEHFDVGEGGGAALRAFAAAVDGVLEPGAADAFGRRSWEPARGAALMESEGGVASALDAEFVRGGAQLFLDQARRERALANAEALASWLTNAASTAELGDPEALAAALAATWAELETVPERSERRRILLEGLRDWTAAGLRSRGKLVAGLRFLRDELAPILAVDGQTIDAVLGQIAEERDGGGRRLAGTADAVVAAWLQHERGAGFEDEIAARLGNDPSRWRSELEALESEGVAVKRFRPIVAGAVAKIVEDQAFPKRLADLVAEQGAEGREFAQKIDEGFRALLGEYPLARPAREAWTRSMREYLLTNSEEAVRAFRDLVGRAADVAAGEAEFARLDALLVEAEGLRPSLEGAEDWQTFASLVRSWSAELRRRERHLTVYALAVRHGDSFALELKPSRLEALQSYVRSLESAKVEAESWTVGAAGPCNAAWARDERPLIRMEIALPVRDRDLLRDGVVELSGAARLGEDGARLILEASPSTAFRPGAADRFCAAEFGFSLRSGGAAAADDRTLRLVSTTTRYDVEPPTAVHGLDGRVLEVTLRDDAGVESCTVEARLGGRVLPLRGTGGTFTHRLGLDDLAGLEGAGAGQVTVTARDGFGNEAPPITIDIAAARGAVLADAAREIEDAFGARAASVRAGDPEGLRVLTEALGAADAGLDRLRAFDAAGSSGSARRVLDRSAAVLRSWISGASPGASLAPAEPALEGALAAVAAMELDLGSTVVDGASLRSGFAAKRDAVARVPDPVDPAPVRPSSTWKAQDVTFGGVTFVWVGTERDPAWLASVEMSRAFFERHGDASLVERARLLQRSKFSRLSWKVEGEEPLVPLSPELARQMVESLNTSQRGQLDGKLKGDCGGAVRFAIPSDDQWTAGATRYAADLDRGVLPPGGSVAQYVSGRSERDYNWYEELVQVGRDPNGPSGGFHFLAGNAEEIVERRRDSFGFIGGAANKPDRELTRKPTARRLGDADSAPLLGLRLALVPAK